jgi:hypothetical protein
VAKPLERGVSRLVGKRKEQMMSERYWEAGEVPEVLLDWVNENVVAAIKIAGKTTSLLPGAEVEDGRMVLTVGGPGETHGRRPFWTTRHLHTDV